MNVANRGVLLGVVFAGLAASAGYLCWDSSSRFEEEWNKSDDDVRLQQEVRRGEALSARLAEVPRTRAAKNRIALDLIARRVTLAEAAARFRELDGKTMDPQTYARILRLYYAGASDEERVCRKVIRHAMEMVKKQPEVAGALVGRLEAELKEHLARRGKAAGRGG